MGDKVAQFNGNYTGNDPAPVGVPIQIPNVVSLNTHNWEGNYSAYNPNEIMGGTYPNMPFPPPILKPQHRHHSFFKEFLEFAVAAAALALIPELAGAIAPMLATILGTATEGLVTTVISNIIAGETLGLASSLAQQERARALGDQNHFNYHQFWESGFENAASAGLSAGLNAEFGAMKFPNPLLKQAFQTDIPRAELFALGMQAANLAYKGGKFDWKALLIAALQAPVNKVIGEVGSQMPTQGPISSALANSGFYGPVPSVFADDLISQEVYTYHFDPQLAAADALGSDAGNMTAFALYDVYKRRADQQAQMGWRKQSQTNKPTEQTTSLDQLNATTNALNKETQKINAELAALGNINPFTDEPLDSGVTNVGATLRGRLQGTSDDSSANTNVVNKNPSYANRQVQHAATDNQNQIQNAMQQQQANLAAKGSSKDSYGNITKIFAESYGKNLLKDAYELAREMNAVNPTQMPIELAEAIPYYSKNPEALKKLPQQMNPMSIIDSYKNEIKAFKSGDSITKAQIEGKWAAEATMILLPGTKGLGRLGLFGRGVEYIDLYRAIKPAELQQIIETGGFENPYGIERKYFSTSLEGAKQFAKMAEKAFGDEPYSYIKTQIPRTVVTDILKANVDRGINTIVVPTENLFQLSNVEILEQILEDRSNIYVNP